MELEGKVALVTGAARGLGRAIAVALAKAGCEVAVSDIARSADGATPYALASTDDLDATVRAIVDHSYRSVAIPADVTSSAEVARLMAAVQTAFGGLDILIANAGIIAAAPVVAMDEAQWDRVFAVNVKGVFLCARAAIPLLSQRGGGAASWHSQPPLSSSGEDRCFGRSDFFGVSRRIVVLEVSRLPFA